MSTLEIFALIFTYSLGSKTSSYRNNIKTGKMEE